MQQFIYGFVIIHVPSDSGIITKFEAVVSIANEKLTDHTNFK